MKKKVMFALMLIIIMVTMIGCSRTQGPAQGEKVELLRVGILPDIDSLPFVVAKEKGYFEEVGANVELITFKNPIERDSAIQSGSIDGEVGDVLAEAFAVENGLDLKITSITNGRYAIVASPESDIKTIEDLKNVEIAISKNTIIEFVVDTLLKGRGFEEDEISKIAIPKIPVRLEMLAEGKVKAACLPEPLASLAVARGGRVIADSTQMDVVPGVMMFREDAIRNKKLQIQKLYEAYEKAALQINENPDVFRSFIVEKAGFPELIKNSFKFVKYSPVSLPAEKDVVTVINWLKEKGLIKKDLTYDDLVTREFVE